VLVGLRVENQQGLIKPLGAKNTKVWGWYLVEVKGVGNSLVMLKLQPNRRLANLEVQNQTTYKAVVHRGGSQKKKATTTAEETTTAHGVAKTSTRHRVNSSTIKGAATRSATPSKGTTCSGATTTGQRKRSAHATAPDLIDEEKMRILMVPLVELLTPRLVEKRGSGRYGKRGVGW
jgi:hypothetical protein